MTRVRCPVGGASVDASVEDQLHVVGSPYVEVLAHHLFEEDPSSIEMS